MARWSRRDGALSTQGLKMPHMQQRFGQSRDAKISTSTDTAIPTTSVPTVSSAWIPVPSAPTRLPSSCSSISSNTGAYRVSTSYTRHSCARVTILSTLQATYHLCTKSSTMVLLLLPKTHLITNNFSPEQLPNRKRKILLGRL